jgi:aminoglycoside phosphotransferase family enzyme/predicted kinase
MRRAMADQPSGQPELVAAMLEPGLYPHSPAGVELRETHISWVFLADELAYKVKKPLTLPFLDYGSLERRRQMCREEVRLNRRFAPRIYRRVVAVVRDGGTWALAPEDDPAAVEYAVEMHRVEEHRSLAALIAAGTLERRQVLAVARRIAGGHAEAPIAPPERRPVEVLVATLEENIATLRDAGASILDRRRLDAAERFTGAFLTARRERLEARADEGLVRDCHGDLRAEHVIVPERGEVYIYDCIEFDPSLRQIDVAADIAFLVMDLAALGAEDSAWALADVYRQAGGDPGDEATLSFFAAFRAWVRTKVDCLRAGELFDSDPERAVQERKARDRLELGHRFAWRARGPLVLALGGVAASGKTTLALELGRVSGWAHVSSDLTRKRLAGVAPEQRAAPEHYSREFTLRTYRELGIAARAQLERSCGVIVDATFHRRDERDAFLAGLGAPREPVLFVVCRASEEALLARARGRELDSERVSDADAAVVARQLAEFEPPDEIASEERADLVTEAGPRELLTEVEALVDARVWR